MITTTTESEVRTQRRRSPLERLVDQHGWLALDDGIVRCPLLVKGKLVGPPAIERASIDAAFAVIDHPREGRGRTAADPYASYARVGSCQVLRHAERDRATMRTTGRWIYSVMAVVDPTQLPDTDIEAIARQLYA